jgi:single-strand selective monofunctional uracil DNA glycosylase
VGGFVTTHCFIMMNVPFRVSSFNKALAQIVFSPPVAYVYKPLEYARSTVKYYFDQYAAAQGRILLLGMNPGPWGMAQTGVPFGEVSLVRDWLRIRGRIEKPGREHPKRPVLGFDCPRSEVSGKRLWGWARERFGAPERFFAHFFVANYCPLMFLDDGARNITPDKLAVRERHALEEVCDQALRSLVSDLAPRRVVGIGKYAEARARIALSNDDIPIDCIPHPSPANPAANRGWARLIDVQLLPLVDQSTRAATPA